MAESFINSDASDRIHQRQLLQQKLAQIREKVISSQRSHQEISLTNSNCCAGQGESDNESSPEGPMTSRHKQILTRSRAVLVENMVPTDLFRYLVARNTLTSADERRIRDASTWEDVNSKLLDVIVTRSDSAFLNMEHALRDTCQEHLADLLMEMEGKRDHAEEIMTPENRQAIHRNRDKLATDITPDDIFNDLISEKILSTAEVSRIKEKGTREETNESLLDYVVRRSDRAFHVLVESLRDNGQEHLANILTSQSQRLEQKRKKLKPLNIMTSDQSSSTPTPFTVPPTTYTTTESVRREHIIHNSTINQSRSASQQSTNKISSSNETSSQKANTTSAFSEAQFVENIPVSSSQMPSLSQFNSSSQSANQNIPTCPSSSCSLEDVKQQIMFMAENAYANIRRRDDSSEAFSQLSKEISQTTESINDSLQVYSMIKEFCEESITGGEGQGQREESLGLHDKQNVTETL